jgi:Transposase DDE domain
MPTSHSRASRDASEAEARLDGIYVVRTNLKAPTLDDSATVQAYKSLAQVERAIRSLKTVDLHIRPIFHWTPQRVRAHVCLCMLAYHVEWHLRQRLAPMLYDDADKATAETLRTSVVAKAQRSPSAVAKQTHGTTPDGLPVHSLQTLLADLATLARNTVTTALSPAHEFVVHTRPTKLQQKALDLLAINPATCTQ